MKSWKTLFADKRWFFLLGIVAFALFASWCEGRRQRGQPPITAQNNRQNSGERRGEQRRRRPQRPDLPEEFEGTTSAVEQLKPDPAPDGPVTLKGIRTYEQDGYDRVIFDFQGDTPPGFHVEYIEKLKRKCGSDELNVTGGTWLLVRMTPAQAHLDNQRTSIGGIDFDKDLKVVKLVRQVCDADGQLEWLIEVADRKPYRAEPLSEPARMLIDIKH